MYDVNLFLGTAAAKFGNEHHYPSGERHPLLVFCRQPTGSEPDWILAESHAENAGWSDVELQQASVLDPDTLDSEPAARPSYEQALTEGWALIVYSDAV